MPSSATSPSDTTTTSTTSDRPAHAGKSVHSKLYHAIMTPVNFVAFILSLYLVDRRYEGERARRHAAGRSGGGDGQLLRPAWLHRLLFSPERPYEWVGQPGPGPVGPPNKNEERYYYHTKQRKLMKMEAADAFGLRAPVLLALSLLVAAAAWAAWRLGWGLAHRVLGVVRAR